MPTCTAAAECPAGLRCVSDACVAASRASGAIDASSDAPPGMDGAPRIRDGGSTGVPESAVLPRRDASVGASSTDARSGPLLDGAVDAAGWNIDCNELPLTGARQLASGVNAAVLSAPSGIYFGSPSPWGDGIVLELLKPNGQIDKPLGDRRINVYPEVLGVGGIFYPSSKDSFVEWFSPSEDRVVATWANTGPGPIVAPMYLGQRIFGFEEVGHDGGAAFRIAALEPAPDAGVPLTHPVGDPAGFMTEMPLQMTADDSTIYFDTGRNVIYELAVSGNAQARPFAEVGGDLRGFHLLGNELFVTRAPALDSPGAGGVVAIDRSTHAQRQLAVGDPAYQSLPVGDSVYYWTSFPARGPSCFALRRVPLAGGAPETLAVSGFMTMVAGETDLYVGTFRGLFAVPLARAAM